MKKTEISKKVLEYLVCPITGVTLEYDANSQELISKAAKLAYKVRSGIPILIKAEARNLNSKI